MLLLLKFTLQLFHFLWRDPPFSHRNPPQDRQPPLRYRFCMMTCYFPEFVSFLAAIHYLQEPKSYYEVIKYLEWQQATDEEL